MKLDDLKSEWQKSIEGTAAPEKITQVIENMIKETNKVERELKRRDILEITIAMFLIPCWGYGLINSSGIIQSLGFIIGILTSVMISYRLIMAKKVEPAVDESQYAFLVMQKQKFVQQKQLLENVFWWYIAPIGLTILLVTLGATVDESGVPRLTEHLTYYYAVVTFFGVGVYFLNKQAVNKKFRPLIENIDRQLANLSQYKS
ncbi:hypothetical protein [Thalassotalea ganghwensis]